MNSHFKQRVAVFDVDGTLLQGDCLWLAARRAKRRWGRVCAALSCLPWLIGWQLRLIRTGRFKQQFIAAFGICDAVNAAETSGRVDWLLLDLKSQIKPEALERLRWHQEQGDRVILCSASPQLLLQPLADWLKVELVCTNVLKINGEWKPILCTPNCKGKQKVIRLRNYLGGFHESFIEAYGDSSGDKELLEIASAPHFRSFK